MCVSTKNYPSIPAIDRKQVALLHESIMIRWFSFDRNEMARRVKQLSSDSAEKLYQIVKINDCDCPVKPARCTCKAVYDSDADAWIDPDPRKCRCWTAVEPCEHGKARFNSVWTDEEENLRYDLIALLQKHLWPEIYADRPTASLRSNAKLEDAQAAVYAKRHEAGLGLWNSRDWLRNNPPALDGAGRAIAGHIANGTVIPGPMCAQNERQSVYDEDAEEVIPEDFVAKELAAWRAKHRPYYAQQKAG